MAPEQTERRYPFPHVKPDRAGRVKLQTLQFFDAHPGYHSATEILDDPVLGAKVAGDGGDRALRVRLLRYSRQGLLRRKWESGEYLYEMTPSGEKRLIYIWEKDGLLDPEKADSKAAIDEMELRLMRVKSILALQEQRLFEKAGLGRIQNIDQK